MRTLTRKSFIGSAVAVLCAPFAARTETPNPLDHVRARLYFSDHDFGGIGGIGIGFDTKEGLYRNAFAMGCRGSVSDLIAGLRNIADALERDALAAVERLGIEWLNPE